ncbi:flagellar export protein FliJ [Betaproteobacteria bacterium PRO4]|uniref:flagellar export protein FliJ n=1 Tax=uncultured Nitrosomonas sp. TaxID=156424 RepID=UPI00256D4C60|nr:flagellar export protein FliJ [uncultured Nitrosomonas sp.]MBE7527835.1 flagellar export protein FliJ [Burkholderiales bacterium]MDL1866752.1 flagellar export protein FliJ [Betaproteobacteria bacterium PRO4]
MASLQSLRLLLDHTQKQADDAALNLGKLNQKQQEAEKTLQMLLEYRENYQARFMATAGNGINLADWRNYMAFIGKLDNAISEQEKNIEHARQRTETGKHEFQTHRKKLKSYDTLLERARNSQEAREQKREQRQLDELVTNKFSRNVKQR